MHQRNHLPHTGDMEPMGPNTLAFWLVVWPLWCKAVAESFQIDGESLFDPAGWLPA